MADKVPAAQARLACAKLPKPIMAIHQAMDDIDKKKRDKQKLSDEITDLEAKVTRLMRRNKAKLGTVAGIKGSILYFRNGYRAELFEKETLKLKIASE